MLVKAARKYNVHVQQGSQRRSHPLYIQAIEELHAGIIGNAYFARGWYTNNRKAIGIGKVVPVPATFDYELWQGPAKRQPFKDNLHPYNWHWRWTYGTAETGNNATHELDVMRWGLDVVHPTRVTSSGGRYAFPKDDWEMPDTQTVLYEFDDNKSMSWEGRCCNSFDDQGDTRGVIFYGSKGTMKIIGSKYQVYDSNNKLVKEIKGAEIKEAMNNTVGQGYSFDGYHFNNFIAAIRDNTKLNSEIEIGFASTLLPLLGNIAQRTGRVIHIDKTNGHILNDKEAMKLWKRDYQPGWEPKI